MRGGQPNPCSVRNLAYCSFARKTANLKARSEIRLCARVVKYPRGALSIHVSCKVLSGASGGTGVSRVRRFLLPPGGNALGIGGTRIRTWF